MWILLLQITAGMPDPGDPAVVGLVQHGGVFCTGTLIAPRVVLTAAHCVAGTDGVALGPMPTESSRGILDRRTHPGFDLVTLSHDLGLLLLDQSIDAPPPPLLASMDASFVGREIRLVGYGELVAGMPELAQKRQGTTVIAGVDEDTFSFGSSPSQTCAGDSGGPAFVTIDGAEFLAGVTSHGDARCSISATDMRVDRVADFIASYVAATAEHSASTGARCLYPEQCAAGACVVPDDGGFGYCSTPCPCPSSMACSSGQCIYWTPSPGAPNASCASDDDCRAGLCAREHSGDVAHCTSICFVDDPSSCAVGSHCAQASNRAASACFSDGDRETGCAFGSPRGPEKPCTIFLVAFVIGVSRLTRSRHPNNFLRLLRIRTVTQSGAHGALPSPKERTDEECRESGRAVAVREL